MDSNEIPPPGGIALEAVQEGGPGFLARMLLVFGSPSRAFAGRIPGTAWIAPLVLLALLQTAESYLLRPLTLERARTRIEQTQMPEQAREKVLEGIEKGANPGFGSLVQGFVGSLLFLFALALYLPALLYWAGTNFLYGGHGRLWGTVSVVALSLLVVIPRSLITVPIKLARGSLDVYTSLALLPVAEPGSRLANALNAADIFEFWYVLVAATGLAILSGIPRKRALSLTLGLWIVWVLVRAAVAYVGTGTWWGVSLGL